MAKEKKKINRMNEIMQGSTKVFLFVMICIFPFYYQNHYINIVFAKRSFFEVSAIVLLLLSIVFAIPASFQEIRKGNAITKLSLTDYFAILFLVTVAVSCLLSPAGSEAFFGTKGRQLGGAILLLCASVYFIVSRFYTSGQFLLWGFFISNCLVCMLIISNFLGIDPLHMYHNLTESEYTYFIGTMGNVNINSGYLGVISALFLGAYYLGEEKISQRCVWGALVLCIYSCFATRSDSWLLAVGGSYCIILAFAMKDVNKLQKFWNLCMAFWAGSVLMKLTECIVRFTGIVNVWIEDLREQTLLYTLIDWKVLCVELLLAVLFWLLIRSRYVQFLKKYGNKILFTILSIVIVVAAILVFPLQDSFGSNRGYIWKRTIANFSQMPLLQQLFGYGPNCFLQSMEKNYGAEMRTLFGPPFVDAHNELLQFLAVTGILGMISYMGMQISLLVSCIRLRKTQPLAVVGIIGITAYMLQGIVNNPQIFTTPLFFLFLGVMDKLINRKNELL